ncbi:MAG: hemerythrin domain-containing protein [Spirochaetes bacterium]|nr:hemerythrin domain-containing protein [Spirochaetota bacterium]
MKPRGTLMIEHRLIEKVIGLLTEEDKIITRDKKVNPMFIDMAVDFIRTYADRTHHGKEEDILFKTLSRKKMDPRDSKMMQDLIDEHKFARKTVAELVKAKEQYISGDKGSLTIIRQKLKALTDLYPEHIKKEDKEFFPSTERYFSGAELEKMLGEFYEFDKKMIHEKYQNVYRILSEMMR